MVVLTAHPLQRIGAFALAALAKVDTIEQLDADRFESAIRKMTDDAVRAAVSKDTKSDQGFFLKSSLSLFPNSPMNHLSNAKRTVEEIVGRVKAWRECPPVERWPVDVWCVLCSRPAVGFYGKRDVPLAESDAYRNSTPRGHDGMALCWPCLSCFHALAYGARLTGGPSLALHSWDDSFLARVVATQVHANRQVIEIGASRQASLRAREVLALRRLRVYEQELRAGVELLVFSNNNRGPTLDAYALDQPLAEWLRRTMQRTSLRAGFVALLHAHRTADAPGLVALARNLFRAPERVVSAGARYLARVAFRQRSPNERRWAETPDLAALCFDYAMKVMRMDKDDLEEIRSMARRVALLVKDDLTGGRLKEFYTLFGRPDRLRGRLQRLAVDWALKPRDGEPGPLLTTRGFSLLFDPDYENPGWFHRQMFLVAVIDQLHALGWRPAPTEDADSTPLPDLDDAFDQEDRGFAQGAFREDDQ